MSELFTILEVAATGLMGLWLIIYPIFILPAQIKVAKAPSVVGKVLAVSACDTTINTLQRQLRKALTAGDMEDVKIIVEQNLTMLNTIASIGEGKLVYFEYKSKLELSSESVAQN